jgi:2-methylcitrate dehydratase
MTRTIAERLAADAAELTFAQLPADVIRQAKRSVLDSVGIGIGGYASEPGEIVRGLIAELGGPPESTIFVSGVKTSCLHAVLANGVMVRYLDFMDRTFTSKEGLTNMGHHGESVVPILALGERQHASGREVITAIVLAYELLTKVSDSVGGNHGIIDRHGWIPEAMRTPTVMAIVAGKLLGLSKEQMANAVGTAGCFAPGVLGILNSGNEALTMARNLKFPWGAYSGILCALLAKRGFRGPVNVFEGDAGLAQTVTGGEMDQEKLKQPRQGWSILNTWIKNFSTEGRMHGAIEATLALINEHDLKPGDIAEVQHRTTAHTARRMGNAPTRRHPKNKYTADHSLYYCTAVAIIDRAVGPEQFTEEKLHDPRVQALADKVFVEADPKLEAYISPGIVEMTTTSGQKYHAEVMRPKGHPMNPMTDADIEHKFRSLARTYMDDTQMTEIIRTVSDLDKLDDIGTLMRLLTVDGSVEGMV